jgi:hypothetical protein
MAPLGPCQAVILALSNVTKGIFSRIDNAATIYALLDAQNRGVGQTPDPTSGRNDGLVTKDTDGLPFVKIRNYKRKVGTSRTVASCNADPMTVNEGIFKMTMYREDAVQIPWSSMNGLCGEAATVLAGGKAADGTRYNVENTMIMQDVHERVMAMIYGLIPDMNVDILTKLKLQAGRNRRTGLATAKNYEFFDPTGRALNAVGYADYLTDYQTMGLGGRPIVIGGAKENIFAKMVDWGNMAASGTDYSKMATNAPVRNYYDLAADTVLGADQFLSMAPGAAKLVTYNKFGGLFNRHFGTGYFGQFTIAEFGDDLRFDLHIEEVSCPGEPYANIIVGLTYDVYTPSGMYAAADPNYLVNGVTLGKIVNAAA